MDDAYGIMPPRSGQLVSHIHGHPVRVPPPRAQYVTVLTRCSPDSYDTVQYRYWQNPLRNMVGGLVPFLRVVDLFFTELEVSSSRDGVVL